ncbi:HK97 gp10 family phage protein [Pasteurellaceae bacterium USgator11]|nr:HK97 gp10 family phage protein [Pasteurellaceae bacterium USgator41]TNG96479.1 HK97 gp10 family phage protein [Pasteurellaceae bacterium UScroc12]TNH00439.1 HK97 gp10 family phage protein [Pasteurellaceae bacterium UScroc31]TNH01730.1 HK97 gp10 family phage protein [Pasteurellaceae bacterium USgator11]
MGSFTIDIGKFVEKTNKRADLKMRKIALDTTAKLKMKTPVDTGDLRGSWTPSIDGMPTSYDGNDAANYAVKFGQTLYISTDKSYAPTLEYGLYPQPGGSKTINGYSTQAPKGMVRITVQEMLAYLNENAARFA